MEKLKNREKVELYHLKEQNLDYFLDERQDSRINYRYEERCELSFELRRDIEDLMEKHDLSARRTYRLLGVSAQIFKVLMNFDPLSNDYNINMPPMIGVLERISLVMRELNG